MAASERERKNTRWREFTNQRNLFLVKTLRSGPRRAVSRYTGRYIKICQSGRAIIYRGGIKIKKVRCATRRVVIGDRSRIAPIVRRKKREKTRGTWKKRGDRRETSGFLQRDSFRGGMDEPGRCTFFRFAKKDGEGEPLTCIVSRWKPLNRVESTSSRRTELLSWERGLFSRTMCRVPLTK